MIKGVIYNAVQLNWNIPLIFIANKPHLPPNLKKQNQHHHPPNRN